MQTEKPLTILLVDDNPNNLKIVAEIVSKGGYEQAFAMSGKQVFEFLSVEKPDMILLDVMMPEMDGYEICRKIKSQAEYRDIPVIFLTARAESEEIVKGFEAGGSDYIIKPYSSPELLMRIKTHLELKSIRDALKENIEELTRANKLIKLQNKKLKGLLEELELTSKIDSLTEVYNRRTALENLDREMRRHKRYRCPFSIIIFDVDFFKTINDTHGHNVGDYILKSIAQTISSQLREQDILSRWGGEEFLLILPQTASAGAKELAERMRSKIDGMQFRYLDRTIHVTLTFGTAEYKEDWDKDEFIKKADDALYLGKRRGRNCVISAE